MLGMELFERERQMSQLDQAFMDACLGEGRLVLISGEAGIGKTSLAESFTSQFAEEVAVYRGTSDALFTPRPLGPFIDIAYKMRSDLLNLIENSPNWYRAAMGFLRI
jgi:predicted ATPase